MIGQSDVPVEDKTVTIAYGTDMTSISFVNFVCSSRETAKVTDHDCLSVGNWTSNLDVYYRANPFKMYRK